MFELDLIKRQTRVLSLRSELMMPWNSSTNTFHARIFFTLSSKNARDFRGFAFELHVKTLQSVAGLANEDQVGQNKLRRATVTDVTWGIGDARSLAFKEGGNSFFKDLLSIPIENNNNFSNNSSNTHPNFRKPITNMSNTVHVKGISSQTSEKEVRDFFSFCGKIQSLSVTPESNESTASQSATVTFEKETAAKTALLLDNTQLGPAQVQVSSAASLDQIAGDKKA